MKLLFLCGCIEPGRDGVGDYTRRLAVEIIRQGHQTALLSLNDHFISEVTSGSQSCENNKISIFRIPSNLKSINRFNKAKEFIDQFNPDWISLQYVPYAFHIKGLPFFLGRNLRFISSKRPFHVMFHEVWVGIRNKTDWRRIITSALQKALIKRMFIFICPLVIHTHLPDYYLKLQRLGFQVNELPLFSNFAISEFIDNIVHPRIFRVGFFSQVGVSDVIISFLIALKEQAAIKEMEMEVLFIGGEETRSKAVGSILESRCSLKDRIKYTGFLQPKEVSSALQSCSLGLTPIPRHVLGKSSSLAAFIAHGVPVAAPNVHVDHSPSEIGFFSSKLKSSIVIEPNLHCVELAKAAAITAKSDIHVVSVSKKFLADLKR